MKRTLTIIVVALFVAWLASLAVLLLFLAGLAGIPALVGAIVCQIGVAAVSAGILIETNTRRAWPDDPYADTTADLLRPPLTRTEDRRVRTGTIDQRGVVQRLSDILEEESLKHPPSSITPPWRIEVAPEEEQ